MLANNLLPMFACSLYDFLWQNFATKRLLKMSINNFMIQISLLHLYSPILSCKRQSATGTKLKLKPRAFFYFHKISAIQFYMEMLITPTKSYMWWPKDNDTAKTGRSCLCFLLIFPSELLFLIAFRRFKNV